MRILLVDDDKNKLGQLRTVVAATLGTAQVSEAHSFQSGLRQALLDTPDLIVLDMTMPTYDVRGSERGGQERRYAGVEILRRLKRTRAQVQVIVVTQFEQFGEGAELVTLSELIERLNNEYSSMFLGAVYYQAADAQWKDRFRAILKTRLVTK